MKYKLGIFGSSAGDMEKILPKAIKIGKTLGEYSDSVILVNGACAGIPYVVAKEAKKNDVEIWGFSPEADLAKLKVANPDDDGSIYSKLIFIPQEFPFAKTRRACMKYRNVISTATCDAGIIISGRWGSLNEFTNLLDMQKVVGVLTGTGGIADELPSLTKKISKEGQGKIIFNDDPMQLVEKLISELKTL